MDKFTQSELQLMMKYKLSANNTNLTYNTTSPFFYIVTRLPQVYM